LFIDPRSAAGRPAGVPVAWLSYWRAYPKTPALLALPLALALLFRHNRDLAIALVRLAGIGAFIYLNYVTNRFESGNLCPGQIVSEKPFLVAVFTDLANDNDSTYPVVKVFSPPWPAMEMPQGTRVATVLLYFGRTPAGHWGDCAPELALLANPNPELHKELLSEFSAQEWRRLHEACRDLPKPLKCGLYPVRVNA
jgi:hypothetical protein